MYSVVLMAAMAGAPETPQFCGFFRRLFCCRCCCGRGFYGPYGQCGYPASGGAYGIEGGGVYGFHGMNGSGPIAHGPLTYNPGAPGPYGLGSFPGYCGFQGGYGGQPYAGYLGNYGGYGMPPAGATMPTESVPPPAEKPDTLGKPKVIEPATKAPSAGRVIVKMPAEARLFAEQQDIGTGRDVRQFITPTLKANGVYEYTMRAEVMRGGERLTETRTVRVGAGELAVVDFGAMQPPQPARIRIDMPEHATLRIDDAVTLKGGSKGFTTPPLKPGETYFYRVEARVMRDGKPVTESRRIEVIAGQTVRVNFALEAPTQAARR